MRLSPCCDARIDIALFGEHGLQRAHAQLGFRELGMVVVVVVVVGHEANLAETPTLCHHPRKRMIQ